MEPLFTAIGLPSNVGWAYVWILALHVAVTASPLVIRLFKPEARFKDFLQRALGWWIFTGSLLVAFAAGPVASALFFAGISLVALRELVALLPIRPGRGLWAIAAMLVVAPYALLIAGAPIGALLTVPVAAALAVPLVAMLTGPVAGFAATSGALSLAIVLSGFCLSLITAPLFAGPGVHPAGGIGLVLYMVFVAQFNDFAQYVTGKLAGRTPIVPALSPKKTWAGVLGGLVASAGFAWALAPVLTPIPPAAAPLLGLLIGLGGFWGDITVSALKRDAGVKDTGAILPGFGGLMDRFDSLIYVAPGFCGVLWALHVL